MVVGIHIGVLLAGEGGGVGVEEDYTTTVALI